MSTYKPMTAEEAAKLSLRPEGVYAFEVLDSQPATSKRKDDGSGGNPMIALTLTFFDENGDRFTVKDWLVHSDNRWAEKKVFDFARHTGLSDKYASGTLEAEDCLGRSGWAKLGIAKGKEKSDGSGYFNDQNTIKYYTTEQKKEKPAQAAPAVSPSNGTDEDAPF